MPDFTPQAQRRLEKAAQARSTRARTARAEIKAAIAGRTARAAADAPRRVTTASDRARERAEQEAQSYRNAQAAVNAVRLEDAVAQPRPSRREKGGD